MRITSIDLITAVTALLLCLLCSTDSAAGQLGQADNDLARSVQRIRALMGAIHEQQHPPKESCKTRRLLVMQYSVSFEGAGSLLKFAAAALAQAAHSNRTLVWGLDLPYTFEHSRLLWQSNSTTPKPISIGGVDLNCDNGWLHHGGGPYSCFFLPLSSCSLEDATVEELVQLGRRGHSDEARLRLAEARRTPASYHIPKNMAGYRSLYVQSDNRTSWHRHEWAAAAAAYIFRLKPSLEKIFDERRKSVWPVEAGGTAECQCGVQRNSTRSAKNGAQVWGFHIRHGDNKAMPHVYGNKRWYPFQDYLKAARQRARSLGAGSCSGNGTEGSQTACLKALTYTVPAAIFVTSDNPDIPNDVQGACAHEELDKWPGGAEAAPCIFFPEASKRYRSQHGAHTAAADGACEGQSCALYPHVANYYKQMNDQSPEGRATRILRSVLEAIEDMHMLSHAHVLAGTGSSHFTVMAVMLSWARHGVPPGADTVIFMDKELVESGVVQCGFMHGSLNKTSFISEDKGYMRWAMLTRRFMEGLDKGVDVNPMEATEKERQYSLRMENNLPKLPEYVFRTEARRWLGKKTHLWPGECPLPQEPSTGKSAAEEKLDHAINLINWGTYHLDLHAEQAMRCWLAAKELIVELIAANDEELQSKRDKFPTYLEAIIGNLGYARKSFHPYSDGEETIRKLLSSNVLGDDQ